MYRCWLRLRRFTLASAFTAKLCCRTSPSLPPRPAVASDRPSAGRADACVLALVVVIVLARAVGSLFAYFQQPPVVGEIIARNSARPVAAGASQPRRCRIPVCADGRAGGWSSRRDRRGPVHVSGRIGTRHQLAASARPCRGRHFPREHRGPVSRRRVSRLVSVPAAFLA